MSRILVVEDNLNILDSLQRSLETDGYEVMVATRAAQAVPLAASQSPDLVILDVELPDGDGFSVLAELRRRGNACPVMFLSARSQEADKLHGFRLGADDYMTKPFSIMELLARISALLRRAKGPIGTGPSAGAAKGTAAEAHAGAALDDDELRTRFGLTARQITVARLLSEGCSNQEIAERLDLSYFTARNHTEQVLLKLGVSSRAAVGAIMYGKG
jgi:DNA-binding response OmpR family regulator